MNADPMSLPASQVCIVCGATFASLIDRDVHSFQKHGGWPDSTIAPAGVEKPSILDRLLDISLWNIYEGRLLLSPHVNRTISVSSLEEAQSELAALRTAREEMRERVADLEMMLRWAITSKEPGNTELFRIPKEFQRRSPDRGDFAFIRWRNGVNEIRIEVLDDGTGLPLLDAAARAAMKGGGE